MGGAPESYEVEDWNGAYMEGWTAGEEYYPAEMAYMHRSPVHWGKGSRLGNKGKGMPYRMG